MDRTAILATVALLLVPVVAADTLDLHARTLDVEGTRLDGNPAIIHADNANGTQMLLRAQRVHVEELVEDRDPPKTLVDLEGPETSRREADHEDVEWTGGLTRSGGYAFVSSSEATDVVLATQAAVVGLPAAAYHDEIEVTPHGQGDAPTYKPPVAGLTLLQSRESRVEVHGDFVLRYWNGRLGGHSSGGEVAYEAGSFDRTLDPVPANPVVRGSRDVFVTLHVTNGTLSLSTPTSTELYAYLDGPARLVGARATLHDAVGTVDGGDEAGTVVLEEFSVLAAATPDGLRVWSPPPQPRSSIVGDLPGPSASVPVAVLALLAVAGLAVLARARRPVSVKMLLDDMDQRAYRRVVRRSGPVMRRTGSEAVAVMKTVALLALGQAQRALRFLEGLPADLRPTDGMDPFLRAHAHNELGQEDEARGFLREALGQNPGLVVELAQFPRLRALLPDDAPSEVYA